MLIFDDASLSVAAEERGSDKGLGNFPQTCEIPESFLLVQAWRFSASAFGDLDAFPASFDHQSGVCVLIPDKS